MTTLNIGLSAKDRCSLELDHVTATPLNQSILDAYDKASFNSVYWARRAMQSNRPDDIAMARWHEAQAGTLEAVLSALLLESRNEAVEFVLPPPPALIDANQR